MEKLSRRKIPGILLILCLGLILLGRSGFFFSSVLADETSTVAETTEETTEESEDFFPAEPVTIPLSSPFTYGDITEDTELVLVTGNQVNLRRGPGMEHDIGAVVRRYHSFRKLGTEQDSEGKDWYKVLVEWDGDPFEAYIASVMSRSAPLSAAGSAYENYLALLGFPSSYTALLKSVHEQYPCWFFIPTLTGMDWFYVLSEEANPDHRVGISLISNSAPSSQKALNHGNYDWETNRWKQYDSGGWTLASDDTVAYYLDPRNFLGAGDDRIFLFFNLNFDGAQTVDGVRAIVRGTFMEEGKAKFGETFSYPEVLYRIGQQVGVSPYYLASSIRQEVGAGGSSAVNGATRYGAIYNYYNIQAYKRGNLSAVEAGLDWASQTPSGSNPYDRPWNDRQKALLGGAKFFAYNYVDRGQSTLYLKKFNVMGGFTHQYMTNIAGAASEAAIFARAYDAYARQQILSFDIPVYDNMPESPCPLPTGDGSPNNFLKSITVGDQRINCQADTNQTEFAVAVGTPSVTVSTQTIHEGARVSGDGVINLEQGDNRITLRVTAENGTTRDYVLNISFDPAFAAPLDTDYTVTEQLISGLEPGTTGAALKGKIRLPQGAQAVFENASGEGKAEGDVLGTGDQLVLTDSHGAPYARYTILVYGDVNGDGAIDIFDLVGIRNVIIRLSELKDLSFKAGDVNRDGNIDIFDLVGIRNHIIRFALITQ